MTVRAIKLIRAIRDQNFQHTKDLSYEERLEYVRQKLRGMQDRQPDRADRIVAERNPG